MQAAYCAAKHAIQGFCDSLWAELLHDGSNVRLRVVNLPAVNTPQFDWSKSRMPRKAQPVPPIFQPEVIADAILWAALNDRRELNVAWPTTNGDHGAHGRFDDRAATKSPWTWASMNRSWLLPLAGLVAGFALMRPRR